MYLPVIHGSTREGTRTLHLARYALARIEAAGHETRLFRASELALGDLRWREWEHPDPPEALRAFVRELARADGFALVFPEYNHSFPGALKNVLDHVYDEWDRKPFAFVTGGGVSGGLRAQTSLAPVIRALGGVVVNAGVAVPHFAKVFGEAGPRVDADDWQRRFDAMVTELAWWAEALADARARDASAHEVRA